MITKLFHFIILISCFNFASAASSLKTCNVDIHAITEKEISIYPSRSTKLIFPWVLDENSETFPFFSNISSNLLFDLKNPKNQNSLVVFTKIIDPNYDGELHDLHISSGGYHFSLALKYDFRPKNHCSTIRFILSDKERLLLVEEEIKKATKSIDRLKDKLYSEAQEKAESEALNIVGQLALSDPDRSNIYESNSLSIANGDKITLNINKSINYGKFTVFTFDIENDSSLSPLYIQSMAVSNLQNNNLSEIKSGLTIKKKIQAGDEQEGVITVNNKSLKKGNILFKLITDKGEVSVKW